jgi:hypothetical protein
MSLVLYVPLLCAVALAAAASDLARRASPQVGATTVVAGALTVALAADTALGVLVGARLLDAAPLATLLGWRHERPAPIPVPVPISLVAAIALVLVAARAWADWRRAAAARRGLRALHHDAPAGELIVVRSPTVLAHALPGGRDGRGRIVVSDGMLRQLDPGERRVLLAHERSHLRHRHDRYRRLVRVAARINPLVRPAIAATDYLLERWADEDAANTVGSRRLVARALARAAVANTHRVVPHGHAGFAAQGVTSRVNALLLITPPRGTRLALALPATLAVIGGLTAIAAAHDLAHLFDLLRGDG